MDSSFVLTAVGTTVILKLDEHETISKGGIILTPSTDKESKQTGVIVSIGQSPEITDEIEIGQRVIFEKGLATPFEDETTHTKYILVSFWDILAIIG